MESLVGGSGKVSLGLREMGAIVERSSDGCVYADSVLVVLEKLHSRVCEVVTKVVEHLVETRFVDRGSSSSCCSNSHYASHHCLVRDLKGKWLLREVV